MNKDSKIFVAGHKGLVGSSIYRKLKQEGFANLIVRSKKDLDLMNQHQTKVFFFDEKPEYVFFAAAKVGGIKANMTYQAEFLYNNLIIACNVINASYESGVKKLLNLGSSCVYPCNAPQPIKEKYLLTSPLGAAHEGYAVAKIAAIKMCRYYNEQYGSNFISVMPTNIYGENDNFNMETAHAFPMILRRFFLAKLLSENNFDAIKDDLKKRKLGYLLDDEMNFENNSELEKTLNKVGAYRDKVVMWGDGRKVYREFMCADDLADACLFLMQNKNYGDIGELVNITSGSDIELKDFVWLVKKIVGFDGKIEYDTKQPIGTCHKLMDASCIKALGWQPKISLETGIEMTYRYLLRK
jgi:GDP-L-fucose synthase